jgi:hypothetical protein
MRRSVDRFCRNCGYEFPRGDTGECRMCARFEQLRAELSIPLPRELASRHARPEEPLNISDPVPSVERPATTSGGRVVFAAQRGKTASADGRSGAPTATVIRTPALRQPADATTKAPLTALAGESPAPAERSPGRRRNRRPTPPPTREGAWISSAAARASAAPEENTVLPARDVHRVIRGVVRHGAAFSDREYPRLTAIWVTAGGALIGASVALLYYLIR